MRQRSISKKNTFLYGAGNVGDSNLTLNLQSGDILANVSNQALILNTGNNTITNVGGTLEATNSGPLGIESDLNNQGTIESLNGAIVGIEGPLGSSPIAVNNSGTIEALNGGIIGIDANIFGTGQVEIGTGGTLEIIAFANSVSISGNLAFVGPNAQLVTADSSPNGGIGGQIVGAVATDSISEPEVPFFSGEHAVWDQTSTTGGTLSVYWNGSNFGTLDLAGQFTSLDFTVSASTNLYGGALISIQNTPVYPENAGNNDEWILSDGQWAASAGPGSHSSDYNVAGTGDWTGRGTYGILWFNPTTGDTDEWQLSNTQWSASVDLGTHPSNSTDGSAYQISGTDAFFDSGNDGVLWTSVNSNGTVATDIWNSGRTASGWQASVQALIRPATRSLASAILPARAQTTFSGRTRQLAPLTSGRS
jgi:hypothetical protein